MSVVITGLPARPVLVPAAPISSMPTVTDAAGGFLCLLRAVQGNAEVCAGVKTLPNDAAPAVGQFAGAAFASRTLGQAGIAAAPDSRQASGTAAAAAASDHGTPGNGVPDQAVSNGAELPSLDLSASVGTATDPVVAVAYAPRAVVSGLPAPKAEPAPARAPRVPLSARTATAQDAMTAGTAPGDAVMTSAPISALAIPAPALAPDAPPLLSIGVAGTEASDRRPASVPSDVRTSVCRASNDRARTAQVASSNDAPAPAAVTARPATSPASATPMMTVADPSGSLVPGPVLAGAETEHAASTAYLGNGGTTADDPPPAAPATAPSAQPSPPTDAETPPGPSSQAVVREPAQATDVPTLQIKLRAEGPDTAKVPDQAATPQRLGPQMADRRPASTGHGDGGQASGQGRNATSAASPSTTPAAAPVSLDPGVPAQALAQAAESATSLPATATPAVSVAVAPMVAPASDLVTSGAMPTSPVSQLGSALLTLSTGGDGTQQMSLRLQPEELGTVEVRIERAPDGSVRVSVRADNPNTLQMISGAQDDLHKALDAAGIPAGRALSFVLGTETRPPNGLADLAFRPVTEDRPASQQSSDGTRAGGSPGQSGSMSNSQGGGNQSLAGGSAGSGGGANTGSDGGSRSWANYAAAVQPAAEPAGDSVTGPFQPEGI